MWHCGSYGINLGLAWIKKLTELIPTEEVFPLDPELGRTEVGFWVKSPRLEQWHESHTTRGYKFKWQSRDFRHKF